MKVEPWNCVTYEISSKTVIRVVFDKDGPRFVGVATESVVAPAPERLAVAPQ